METTIQKKRPRTPNLQPYTLDEIRARIAQSERDAAAGLGQDSEEMFRELEEEFAPQQTCRTSHRIAK